MKTNAYLNTTQKLLHIFELNLTKKNGKRKRNHLNFDEMIKKENE